MQPEDRPAFLNRIIENKETPSITAILVEAGICDPSGRLQPLSGKMEQEHIDNLVRAIAAGKSGLVEVSQADMNDLLAKLGMGQELGRPKNQQTAQRARAFTQAIENAIDALNGKEPQIG